MTHLLTFVALVACLWCESCKAQKCPSQAEKVKPSRHVLRNRFTAPFVAHLRFNVTGPQRLFIDTSMDLSRSMIASIDENQNFVLTSGSVEAFVPIKYNKVCSVTFAVSPTFLTDMNIDDVDVIRSPSTLTIDSPQLLIFWYKNIFL